MDFEPSQRKFVQNSQSHQALEAYPFPDSENHAHRSKSCASCNTQQGLPRLQRNADDQNESILPSFLFEESLAIGRLVEVGHEKRSAFHCFYLFESRPFLRPLLA